MSRARCLVSAGLMVIAVLVVTGTTALVVTGITAQRQEPPLVSLVFPKVQTDALLWPNNHSWVWEVKGLDPAFQGSTVSLVIRVVHEKLQEGASEVISPHSITKAASEAEISPGKIKEVKPSDTIRLSVQLIDFGEVGLVKESDDRFIRLLLNFKAGNSGTLRWNSKHGMIKGERLIGYAPHTDASWKDGELHLQSLFVHEAKDRLAVYDIVVVQSK